MSKVQIDWDSDPKKLLASMKQIEAENIKLKGRIEEVARGSAKAAREHAKSQIDVKEAIRDTISEYGHAAAGLFALHKAAEVYNEDLKVQIERSKEALSLQIGKAAGRVALANSLPPMNPNDQAQLDERVRKLRDSTLHKGAANILAGAASEGPGMSMDQLAAAAKVAGLLQPGEQNEGTAAALAGNIVQMQRLSGARSAEEAYGKLSSLASSAALPVGEVAGKLVPAAETMTHHGESFEQSAAALAAFTARFGDVRKGRTAYEDLAGALDDRNKFRPTANIQGGTLARLEALRNDPAMLRKFLKSDAGTGLNAEGKAALGEYMSGQLRGDILAAQGSLPGAVEAEAQTNARIEALHGNASQQMADRAAHREIIEHERLDDLKKAVAGNAALSLDAMTAENPSFFGRTTMAVERFIRGLNSNYTQESILNEMAAPSWGGPLRSGFAGSQEMEKFNAFARDLSMNAGGDLLEETKKTNDLLQKNNQLLQQQIEAERGKRGRSGPVVNPAGVGGA